MVKAPQQPSLFGKKTVDSRWFGLQIGFDDNQASLLLLGENQKEEACCENEK